MNYKNTPLIIALKIVSVPVVGIIVVALISLIIMIARYVNVITQPLKDSAQISFTNFLYVFSQIAQCGAWFVLIAILSISTIMGILGYMIFLTGPDDPESDY